MQGVYFVIGYEKEPSPLLSAPLLSSWRRRVHSISVHFICEARVRHFREGRAGEGIDGRQIAQPVSAVSKCGMF